MGVARCASAVAGALLAALLPLALLHFPTTRAAWCWDTKPPMCKIAIPAADGQCKGAADGRISAGATCDPECPAGTVPDGTTLVCPPSGEPPNCIGDATNMETRPWWNLCLQSDLTSCRADHEIAATWTCKTSGTLQVVTLPPEPEDPTKSWDAATVAFTAGLAVFPMFCAALLWPPFLKGTACLRILTEPRAMNWTLANITCLFLLIISIVLWVISLALDLPDGSTQIVFLTGLISGLLSSLPIWWSFFKLGVHNCFLLSREAAWRIHVALGGIAVVISGFHGVLAIAKIDGVFGNTWWVMGAIGWLLMLFGVFPADVHLLVPHLLTYDNFKLGHYLSMLGFILALLHMGDHALKFSTTRSWFVFLLNATALLFFAVQKVFVQVKASMTNVSVQEADVKRDSGGTHIFLKLKADFNFQAGQWAHVKTPLSLVPHPFTIVPGERGSVQFFIKSSGKFTEKLATACSQQPLPKISLEGPYGMPPLPAPHINAVVFVLGGVGVTPALSLATMAKEQHGAQVYLYWNCRSAALVQRCAPFLKSSLEPGNQKISLTGGDSIPEDLCDFVQKGRSDIAEWLASTSKSIASTGPKAALLFICGPSSLAAAAKASASMLKEAVTWTIHIEEFNFLPRLGAQMRKQKRVEPEVVQVGKASE